MIGEIKIIITAINNEAPINIACLLVKTAKKTRSNNVIAIV
jgi:hypothetical protein